MRSGRLGRPRSRYPASISARGEGQLEPLRVLFLLAKSAPRNPGQAERAEDE